MPRLFPCALFCAFAALPAGALAQSSLPDPEMSPDSPDQAPADEPSEVAPAAEEPVPDEFADEPLGDVPERVGPRIPEGGVPEILGPLDRAPQRVERPRGPPPPPPPPPLRDSDIIVSIVPRLSISGGSGFDSALAAHRYAGSDAIGAGSLDLSFALPDAEWFFLGARIGARGRTWQHPELDAAAAAGGDLQLTAQARYTAGRVFELGFLLAGGLGVLDVRVNGVPSDQVVVRLGFEAVLGFRIGDDFSFGPRIGYDYFQWENMNAWGDGLEMGGFTLGLALEARQ